MRHRPDWRAGRMQAAPRTTTGLAGGARKGHSWALAHLQAIVERLGHSGRTGKGFTRTALHGHSHKRLNNLRAD